MRPGYHVSVQYGANQPGYDLIAEKTGRHKTELLRISVKGSQSGEWPLVWKEDGANTYYEAIAIWEKYQHPETVFMLVQFKGIPMDGAPVCYVTRPKELATYLSGQREGQSDNVLRMKPRKPAGSKIPAAESIPEGWRFSTARIDTV